MNTLIMLATALAAGSGTPLPGSTHAPDSGWKSGWETSDRAARAAAASAFDALVDEMEAAGFGKEAEEEPPAPPHPPLPVFKPPR